MSLVTPIPSALAAGRTGRTGRTVALLWPLGLVVVLLRQTVDQITTPVSVGLGAAYLLLAVLLARRAGVRPGPVTALGAAPVLLFAVAAVTAGPTGDEPGLMQLNTAVLLVVATVLALAAVDLVVRHRASPAARAASVTTALLLLGTVGFLVNLLGRVAVVLTGAAGRQAAVEDEYWLASEYLRGLPGDDDPLAYLLTWMDLVQLGYVATAYVATAGLARLLRAEGVVGPRAGRVVERTAWTAAALLTLSTVAAVSLPRAHDAVPAALAFGLSIPFMTTLLPFALAIGALRHRQDHRP